MIIWKAQWEWSGIKRTSWHGTQAAAQKGLDVTRCSGYVVAVEFPVKKVQVIRWLNTHHTIDDSRRNT